MTIHELLDALREREITVRADAGVLVVRPGTRLTPEMAEACRRYKPLLYWLDQHRRPDYPPHEIWLSARNWSEWMIQLTRWDLAHEEEQDVAA